MHVVVVTKSVPDTESAVSVDSGGQMHWGDKLVVNPWDEYAITEAILLKTAHNLKATVLTLGTEEYNESLKHGLAVGCDQAVRVWDAALAGGYDSLTYARAVAAAIKKLGDVALVIFGREFPDLASDAHIFQVARKLGWTSLGYVARIEAVDFTAGTLRVRRLVEHGTEIVSSKLPAVISVLKDINEPKYPTFIGIRKAAKAEIPVWSAADLGLDAGALTPKAKVIAYRELPRREGAVEIIEGASAQEKAARLVQKLIEEKVL